MHPVINQVTENIQNRSAARRAAYLNQIDKARTKGYTTKYSALWEFGTWLRCLCQTGQGYFER